MRVIATELDGVVIVEPRRAADARGWFMELWRDSHADADPRLPARFVQDNVSVSRAGVLRGLHLQHPTAQGKLVSVLAGEVLDVAADVRHGSPTFGRWVGVTLSAQNGRQLYIPPGFAHGFAVTEGDAVVSYKCTAYYEPAHEITVRWDDPTIGVAWPVDAAIVSPRDAAARTLAEFAPHELPPYAG